MPLMSGQQGLGPAPQSHRTCSLAQSGLIPSPWVSAKAQAGFIKQTACPSAGPGLRGLRPWTLMLPQPLGQPVGCPAGWAPGPWRDSAQSPQTTCERPEGSMGLHGEGAGQEAARPALRDMCVGGGWRSGPLTAPGPNCCPQGSSRSPQQHPGQPEALAPGPPGSTRRPPDVGACPRGPASCVGRGPGQWGRTKDTGTRATLTL